MKAPGDGEIFITVPVSAMQTKERHLSLHQQPKTSASSTCRFVSNSAELFQEYDFIPRE